jgi:hypothetical protein
MAAALKIFKTARIIGILLAVVAILLSVRGTKNENNLPAGFFTPIIALEFIQNTQQVLHFFDVKDPVTYEADLIFGNNVDYLFMTLYSLLIFCIALGIYKINQSKLMFPVMIFSVVMLLSDALENHQIAQIIFYYKTAPIDSFLSLLSIFTWLKWSAIATSFLFFSTYFLKGNLFYKIIGSLGITCFILCIAAFLQHGILNEIFALSIILEFLLLIIFVFRFKGIQIV